MKLARALAAAAVLSATSEARGQSADSEAIALSWRAPPECPTQESVRAEVDRLLGGTPTGANHEHLVADLAVERTTDGYRVRIRTKMGAAEGERSLDAPSCDALADASALVVALTFDPEAVAAHREAPRPPPRPEPAPRPSAPATPAPTATPKATQREATPPPSGRFLVAASLSGSVGALPSFAYGIGGRLGFASNHLRIEAGAAYWPTQRATLADRPSAGGDFNLVTGSALGCYAPIERPLELGPCALLEIGRMAGSGFGVKSPGEGSSFWFAPGLELLAAVPLGRYVRLRAELGGLVPVVRHPFVLDHVGNSEPVHRASVLVAEGALGAEVRF